MARTRFALEGLRDAKRVSIGETRGSCDNISSYESSEEFLDKMDLESWTDTL